MNSLLIWPARLLLVLRRFMKSDFVNIKTSVSSRVLAEALRGLFEIRAISPKKSFCFRSFTGSGSSSSFCDGWKI